MIDCVRHGKGEFLSLFESGELQSEIVGYLEGHGIVPNDGEKRSWNNSYAFMDIVLRSEDIPAETEVLCELLLPGKGWRADMVLLSPSGDARSAIIVELKQWDVYYLESSGKRSEKDRGSDPVGQVARYRGPFEKPKAELGVGRVRCCVYLHGIKEADYRATHLAPERTYEDIEVFYQGDTDAFRAFIREEFEGDALLPTKAIARARDNGYWPCGLPSKAGSLREKLIELGYARPCEGEDYDYGPTPKGVALGIRKYTGLNARKGGEFTSCSFTDAAMRRLAEELMR